MRRGEFKTIEGEEKRLKSTQFELLKIESIKTAVASWQQLKHTFDINCQYVQRLP